MSYGLVSYNRSALVQSAGCILRYYVRYILVVRYLGLLKVVFASQFLVNDLSYLVVSMFIVGL